MKTVSMLCVGEELIDGRTRDLNAIWLARASREHGFELRAIQIIGDVEQTIVDALEHLSQTCEFLLVSGGLGPTADDITRDAAAHWLQAPLQLDEDAFARLKQRFETRGYPLTPNNRSQCMFPQGAEVLKTEVGSAPGFTVQKNGCTVAFLPGVPDEFRWFVQTYFLPQLAPPGRAENPVSREKLVFFGAGESWLETQLAGIEELAAEVGGGVGYLAKSPLIEIHLKAPDAPSVARMRDFVLARVDKWLIARGSQSTEAQLGVLMQQRQATVTTAESCTGGQLAARLTSISGVSNWFEQGFITYSNHAKSQAIGVAPDVIAHFGAVSPQVACQMAAGAQKTAQATFALSVTGIAGPTGGTPEKPVGTVHFALATPDGVWHLPALFAEKSRKEITSASVYTAMSLLLWHLEGRMAQHPVNGPFSPDEVWAPGGVQI